MACGSSPALLRQFSVGGRWGRCGAWFAGDVEAVVPTIRAARAWAHRDAAVHDGRCPASPGGASSPGRDGWPWPPSPSCSHLSCRDGRNVAPCPATSCIWEVTEQRGAADREFTFGLYRDRLLSDENLGGHTHSSPCSVAAAPQACRTCPDLGGGHLRPARCLDPDGWRRSSSPSASSACRNPRWP